MLPFTRHWKKNEQTEWSKPKFKYLWAPKISYLLSRCHYNLSYLNSYDIIMYLISVWYLHIHAHVDLGYSHRFSASNKRQSQQIKQGRKIKTYIFVGVIDLTLSSLFIIKKRALSVRWVCVYYKWPIQRHQMFTT